MIEWSGDNQPAMSAPSPIRVDQADPDRLLDVPEVACMLNMSEAWVRSTATGCGDGRFLQSNLESPSDSDVRMFLSSSARW